MKCLVGVHSNGLDLVLMDLSRDDAKLVKVKGHEKVIRSVGLICDDEHVVTGGEDKTLRVWQLQRNDEGVTLTLKEDMTFKSTVERLLVHPVNKMVLVWLAPNILKLRHINNLKVDELSVDVQDSDITGLSMNDTQIVYSTNKGNIYVWNYENPDNPVFQL